MPRALLVAAVALAGACAHAAPPLVLLTDPRILTDARYATADNFTGAPLPGYCTRTLRLRPEAAAALSAVAADLAPAHLALLVFDAYRPPRATAAMVAWAERTGRRWVLDEGYVARTSNHARGVTVDVTLVDATTGKPLDMGVAFDTFAASAHTTNATGAALANRLRLEAAMARRGFVNLPTEWWHYVLASKAGPVEEPPGCP